MARPGREAPAIDHSSDTPQSVLRCPKRAAAAAEGLILVPANLISEPIRGAEQLIMLL